MRHLAVLALASLFLPFLAPLAWAHGGAHHGLHWTWQAGVLAPFAVAAVWYGCGLAALARGGRLAQVAGRGRVLLFVLALAILLVALESPLDGLGDSLLSAHMVQHLLLIIVVAPLLAYSRQTAVFLWGLPRGVRGWVLQAWRRGAFGSLVRALLNPLVVWMSFSAAFVFWHVPGPYRWALHDDLVHALEHLCFLVTALAFWAVVFDTALRRRLGHGATLLFIVATAILSSLPGALLLFAPHPLYAADVAGAAQWGLTPLEDQQLAGVVMWVPMEFCFVIAGMWVFVHWMESAERASTAALSRTQVASVLAMLLAATGLLFAGSLKAAAAEPATPSAGDARRGATLIAHYGCGYCHTIPGIDNAKGRVGPPLTGFGDRLYVAGMLPNTPENLVAWIEDPQRIVPGNVMPVLGVGDQDARDIAAYLQSLR